MPRQPSEYDYQSGYNEAAPPPPPPAGRSGVFATTEDGLQRVPDGDFGLYPNNRPGPPPPPPAMASFVSDTYQHGAADFYIPPQPPSLLAYEQPSIFASRDGVNGVGGSAAVADSAASCILSSKEKPHVCMAKYVSSRSFLRAFFCKT